MTAVWDVPAVREGIERQAEELAAALDGGASLVGWKVGVGAPASMQAAGIDAPLVGFLTSRTVVPSGAGVSVHGWTRPMLEPEMAIYMGADVDGGARREDAAAAIAAIGAAIELADVDAPLNDLRTVVGGNIFHRAVLFAEADAARRGGQVDDLVATIHRGGETVAESGDVTALTGHPVDLVLHVAAWLAATGQRLRAGQVIIGGSIVPIMPVEAGDTVVYRCSGLGSLEVSLTA